MCIEPNPASYGPLSNYDILMTYSPNSTIQVTYWEHDLSAVFTNKNLDLDKKNSTGQAPIAFVSSNCEPNRDHFVSELQKYIQVDALGVCLHNQQEDDGIKSFKRVNFQSRQIVEDT
jgi:hypothetical protein